MPEGESIKDVSERSVEAFDKICLSQKDNDLSLLVAHDAVNKTLICKILGINYSNIWMIKQGNGGITINDLFNDPNKPPVISALNITTHLGGILDSTASGLSCQFFNKTGHCSLISDSNLPSHNP